MHTLTHTIGLGIDLDIKHSRDRANAFIEAPEYYMNGQIMEHQMEGHNELEKLPSSLMTKKHFGLAQGKSRDELGKKFWESGLFGLIKAWS